MEEAKTGLALGPDGAFILLVENLQVPACLRSEVPCPECILGLKLDSKMPCAWLHHWLISSTASKGMVHAQANVKAKFQYQRTTFPQIGGDGSAYVTAVGGYAKLGIRVANDGAGRPLVSHGFLRTLVNVPEVSLNRAAAKDIELVWHGLVAQPIAATYSH